MMTVLAARLADVGFYRPTPIEPGTTLYKVLHRWLRLAYPPTGRCEWCGTTGDPTHYATARSDGYTTNRADWLELCVSCHTHFDGRTGPNPRKANRGVANGRAKLCEADVREIRELYATGVWSQPQVARLYGVTHILIGKIVRRELWRCVT